MGRSRFVFAMLVALGVMGCAAPPMQVVEYRAGRVARIVEAPRNDTYTLYAHDGHERIESITCESGEAVGFARHGGSGLEAVAGEERIRLAEGSYAWVIDPPAPAAPARRPYRPSPPPTYHGGRWGGAAEAGFEVFRWVLAGAPHDPAFQ